MERLGQLPKQGENEGAMVIYEGNSNPCLIDQEIRAPVWTY